MRRIMHLVQIYADASNHSDSVSQMSEPKIAAQLAGYFLNQSSYPPRSMIKYWGYKVIIMNVFNEPEVSQAMYNRQLSNGINSTKSSLIPIGRLIPVTNSLPSQEEVETSKLQTLESGKAYIITSASARRLVTSALAEALKTVFEQFAIKHGFSREKPLEISLSCGYKEGRAADITAVAGRNLLQWKQEWDQTLVTAQKLTDPQQRAVAIAAEQRRNLGYGLYEALQAYGGWRLCRNVMQLFGPWTATEGPWKAMKIENPTVEERQRIIDQRLVLRTFQDHIYVSR